MKRREAKALGLKTYPARRPCPHGHQSMRYVGAGNCVECLAIRGKSQETKARKRRYQADNAERLAEIARANYYKNKERHSAKAKERYAKNRQKVIAAAAKRYRRLKEECPDEVRRYGRESMRAYVAKNIDAARKRRREYVAARLRSDPRFRLHWRIGRAMRHALKSKKGGRSWESLVGYSCEELAAHLENKFLPGMTWENMSKWHIDHVVPQAAFQYVGPNEQAFRDCWAITNLQPLWAEDNLKKGAKLCG